MYRITYVLGTEGELRNRALKKLLAALTMTGKAYLEAHPETPLLYKSGVRYEEEPGEQDQWQDIPITMALGHGDAEDLACWRAAELQARGIEAWPTFDFEHGCLHPKVRLPNGKLEDPARVLGMRGHDKPCMGFMSDKGETRIEFLCDTFKGKTRIGDPAAVVKAQALSNRTLQILLNALMLIDVDFLLANPHTPRLYDLGIRYEMEPPGREEWQDIPTNIRRKTADCLPLTTLVLMEDYTYRTLGDLRPGDVIMGDGEWTRVVETMATGEKTILGFELDNGALLRCSPEHRLFLQDGTEIRAKDVTPGMRLKCPENLPTANEAWQPEGVNISNVNLAWLVGIYIADGWHRKDRSGFAISGDDVTPKRGKREQKDRVQAMMRDAGINTRRAKKYVDVHDRTLAEIMAACGGVAPLKHVAEMRLNSYQVEAMIEGLRADSSLSTSGTVTHGTVSPLLALQLRTLYRMLGRSVHVRRWDEHGGLGENPIYRITEHKLPQDSSPKHWQVRAENLRTSTKVRAVRELASEECGDIETESHRFYLPESDVVVHNCEDLATHRAAELRVYDNVKAYPTFNWRLRPSGAYLYHIQTAYPDGRVEDPSKALGM